MSDLDPELRAILGVAQLLALSGPGIGEKT
jgi:hypothetical protein